LLAAHPEYSNEDVRQALRVSAKRVGTAGIDQYLGYGRVNAAAALGVPAVLESKITAPADGALALKPVTISGVARGSGFASYMLAYGRYPTDPAFVTLRTGISEVSGELGVVDLASLDCVYCTIRLTAYNTAGQAFVDQIQIVSEDVRLVSPGPGTPLSTDTYKAGATILIQGTAVAAGFQNYQVQWAAGLFPTDVWRSDGVTVTGGGTTPVSDGLLATWATPNVTSAGYYTISLTVNEANGSVSTAMAPVYLEPDLLSNNWPQGLSGAPAANRGVVPAMNSDGTIRLMLSQQDINYTGAALWTLPMNAPARQSMLPGFGNWGQPAAASLDGGPADEVVAGDWTTTEIFQPDGINYSTITPPAGLYSYNAQPQMAHLGSSSEWDIVSVGRDIPRGVAYIFAWRPDGSSAGANFPIQVQDLNDMRLMYAGTRCIVADVDGDGRNEIVALEGLSPSTFTLRRFGSDGSPQDWRTPVLNGQPRAMAAADLDHDGRIETIVASVMDGQLSVRVFQPDGSERKSWTSTLPLAEHFDEVFLAVADLNRSGTEQIVVCDEAHIYVFNNDGASRSGAWPLYSDDSQSSYGSVAIGDIDGDGLPEIVTTHTGPFDMSLRAFRRDGTLARSWKLTGRNGLYPGLGGGVTIGDFDQDGITDIAVAYWTGSGFAVGGVVTVLTTGAPFNPAANDWPMIYQNPRNSPVLERRGQNGCFTRECNPPPRGGGGGTRIPPHFRDQVRHP
jgi:hypothetical protein